MFVCFLQLLPTFKPPPDLLYAGGQERRLLILLKPAPSRNLGQSTDRFSVAFSRPSMGMSLPRRPGTLSAQRKRAAFSRPAAGCASARAPEARRARRGRRTRPQQDRSLRMRSRCTVGWFGFVGSRKLLPQKYMYRELAVSASDQSLDCW
jgi:hypothetical protein